jgi:hypothetical protein
MVGRKGGKRRTMRGGAVEWIEPSGGRVKVPFGGRRRTMTGCLPYPESLMKNQDI